MSKLLLVDGSSYLYRAFHALPDLRNRAGEPTGAIYGVISMLRRLEADHSADFRAVVFDAKGKTFRDDWYPAYKAQRPPMPEDLVAQIEPLHACVRALGWPILMIEGVEADDVIGTLTRQASEQEIDCIVSTGDKDLAQLVNSRVRLVNTMSNEMLDEAGVLTKFGVPPTRIVDYLTLVGDTVDNVPGVEKVGPKTAVKWLNQYGSLDAIIEHAAEIKGAVGDNLRHHLDFLPLGRKLVTVACDLELPLAPTDLSPQAHDNAQLAELFARLEFKTWLKEVESGALAPLAERNSTRSPAAAESVPAKAEALTTLDRSGYETLLAWPDLERWLHKIEAAPLTALDTETTSLDSMQARLVGISFAVEEAGRIAAAYLPLGHSYAGAPDQLPLAEALEKLRPWLESNAHPKLGQHLKYDRHIFANHGINLRGIVEDTLLESYVLESDKSHDLGALASRHLGLATIAYDDITGKGAKRISFAQVALEQAAEYGAEDADITLRVHQHFAPQLAAEPRLERLYRDIELPAAEVLFRMERNGVLIDVFSLARQSDELGRRLLQLEQEAHALAGQPFNLASPKQLAEILFTQQGLPVVKKTPSGTPSTDEEVLSQLAEDYPLPKLLLQHRSLNKLKGTYTDKLPQMVNPATGRVHTSFSQAVAVTGRLASSDPNLQNIPVRTEEGRRIRSAFIAPPGHGLVSADYSQIELRIMAHLSNDERLLQAFAQGEDVHRATAAEIFGITPLEVGPDQRRAAKVINFGLIYGMSAFGLARELGLERSAAAAYMERYFARYPGVARYMEETRQAARDQGYVETVFGRRLWLPEIRSSNVGRRQGAERAAINAPMQGTAADLIKLAMIAVQRWLEETALQSRLILQVHDELVLEVPDGELAQVKTALPRLMGGVARLAVPLLVDVGAGPNWDEAH
ncbi:DNA polymerase I [Denitratisoma oestradiolicum]|uniref:DNA polymerase I n=1 Tax=Denitratisoma oestradiolicum TaxID=311182 RepID=A0A6S6Y0R9_9PROT|nr:DNA polymerase I [Denitratisoma oestradiolicum]TWO79311.1 DNA polymerase I [Denitratisoma oestradiolicum]CAB1370361.1 fused DNA polymerase I 5'->3' exonuclease; 3'->5' polymerase; 3'->5' exonuclease [Denitratisoma oestradiolicum]